MSDSNRGPFRRPPRGQIRASRTVAVATHGHDAWLAGRGTSHIRGGHRIGLSRSTGGGRTWPRKYHFLLDEDRGAGYPSLTRSANRHLDLVCEDCQAHRVVEKVLLGELLDPARRKQERPCRRTPMHREGCHHQDHPRIGRRTLLQAGLLSLLGTGPANLLRLKAHAGSGRTRRTGKARSVAFIFQSGGPSQHETFDQKPDAPSPSYGTTQTTLPGVRLWGYLPRLARRAGRFSLVRTMHHSAGREFRIEHVSCHYLLHTGTTELPPSDTNASIVNPRPGRSEWPSIDRCLSGFLDDLEQRGLLGETLVVMCGEMGRTPRISPITPGGKNASGEVFTPGRHHWGDVFPCLFAGGGIRPGQVVGQRDKQVGLPASEAYTPADLAATIFHLMDVGPDEEFPTPRVGRIGFRRASRSEHW